MRTKITALIIVSLLVSVGCFAKGTGTLANPYSAAEACEAVKNFTWTSNADYESTGEVYVKGIISRIANSGTFTESGMFGNASFFIKDKVGDQEFYCFRILYMYNQKFEQGQADIKVGDEVIVCGKLMNYHENTPQTVSNNAFLYSLNGIINSGTLAHPYSAAEACAAVKNLTWTSNADYESIGEVYVKGIISRIASRGTYSEGGSYGNASFFIKNKGGDQEFYCFRVYYLGNQQYQEWQGDIKEGDEVIICGKLMNYQGNTPETVAAKAYLYSIDRISGRGTLTNPYSVAAACKAVKNLFWMTNSAYESTDEVYVKGIISRIVKLGTFAHGGSHGTAMFYIKDEVGDKEFYCFNILYLDNKPYQEGQGDIKVGDEVIICGKLMNYRGNTPATVPNKAYLYSIDRTNSRGTLAKPYSVAQACRAVEHLTWTSNADYESTDEVFVKGTISRIANSSTFTETGMFGNASFFIKDKVGDQEYYCYRILYLGNQMFEQGQTDIKVGDEVIVCGKLMNYHENTPQTVSNNAFLYSLNGDNGGYSFIATDLHQVTSDKSQVQSNEWYTIDGRKLNGMPVKKGVYIQNGKKTINN